GLSLVPIARRVPGGGQEGRRGALRRERPGGADRVPRVRRSAGPGAGAAGIGVVRREASVDRRLYRYSAPAMYTRCSRAFPLAASYLRMTDSLSATRCGSSATA